MPKPDQLLQRSQLEADAATEGRTDPRWRIWYVKFASAVYGYVRFHVSSPDDAEDLTAEVFLKAFRSADRYDPAKASVLTWLLAVARNTLRDHQRRARRREFSVTGFRDLQSNAPTPEERLLWEEEVRRTLEALSALSDRDREIIALRYGSGLATAEVAESLGLSESAVTTRLWRALDRLRRRMDT